MRTFFEKCDLTKVQKDKTGVGGYAGAEVRDEYRAKKQKLERSRYLVEGEDSNWNVGNYVYEGSGSRRLEE